MLILIFLWNLSIIRSGLGWILCTIGILSFVVIFYCKLHSIEETIHSTSNNSGILFSRFKYVFVLITSFLFVSIIFLIFNFDDNNDIVFLNMFLLIHTVIIFIFITRHHFSQNPNFKLYLSIYHHQPPPVLPWQLPYNFDPNSVKLKFVLYKNE